MVSGKISSDIRTRPNLVSVPRNKSLIKSSSTLRY